MEPRIVTLPELHLVGMQTFGNCANGGAARMWEVLRSNDIDIPARMNPKISYGVETYTRQMETNQEWFYFAGVEVENFYKLPIEMTGKLIPENRYACFKFQGKVSPTLGIFFQEIYKVWLPNSDYIQAGPYDLERYDDRFLGADDEDSVLDILIPIRPRDD
jgi:AraC family transcriptional regulator